MSKTSEGPLTILTKPDEKMSKIYSLPLTSDTDWTEANLENKYNVETGIV